MLVSVSGISCQRGRVISLHVQEALVLLGRHVISQIKLWVGHLIDYTVVTTDT